MFVKFEAGILSSFIFIFRIYLFSRGIIHGMYTQLNT